jgi:hypothetical protein
MPHVGAGLQPGVRRIPFIIGIVLEMPKESRATIDGMPSQDVAVPTLLQPLQTKFSPTRLDVALNKVVYTRVMEMSESVERTALRLTVGDFENATQRLKHRVEHDARFGIQLRWITSISPWNYGSG